ncbi:MAG: hypothetical protein QOI88_3245 [Gammaproteobacteria bacterium]|jgi:hypothetical protein|nr:hypothetical protein [Gammaproteobacteria bacterium]
MPPSESHLRFVLNPWIAVSILGGLHHEYLPARNGVRPSYCGLQII